MGYGTGIFLIGLWGCPRPGCWLLVGMSPVAVTAATAPLITSDTSREIGDFSWGSGQENGTDVGDGVEFTQLQEECIAVCVS
jgi:hypothetical protein